MVTDSGCQGVIALGSSRAAGHLRKQMRLVSAIASQSGLLVENADLAAQLERHAILNDRDRLGREIHDGLAQTLGFLKMRSQQIAGWLDQDEDPEHVRVSLRDLSRVADQAYQDLREAIDGLRAPGPRGHEFGARLRELVESFAARTGVTVDVRTQETLSLPPAALGHLLRLVQEALGNIQKHAGASHAGLLLEAEGDSLRLTIEDDGSGFDPSCPSLAGHHGLTIMRERADLLGADLQVWSKPGHGTRVSLEWSPIAAPE
jgi:signal transduction histidine kinase